MRLRHDKGQKKCQINKPKDIPVFMKVQWEFGILK